MTQVALLAPGSRESGVGNRGRRELGQSWKFEALLEHLIFGYKHCLNALALPKTFVFLELNIMTFFEGAVLKVSSIWFAA